MLDLIRKIEDNIRKYPGGCWIWNGKWNGHQPDFRYQGIRKKVREFLYGWEFGIFPPKKVFRTCLNDKCVHPLHHSPIEPNLSLMELLLRELPSDTECHQAGIDQDGPYGGFVLPKNTNESKGNRPKLPLDQFFDPEKDIDTTENE